MFNECLEIRLNTAYFASLKSLFHHHMKHHENYSAARRIFNSFLSVSSFSGHDTEKNTGKK